MHAAAAVVGPHELDWKRLVVESPEPTCEAYAETLQKWLVDPGIDEGTRAAWCQVLPLVGLRPMLVECDVPFCSPNAYRAMDKATMASLVAALPVIDDPDLRARIIDVAWQKRACSHELVEDGVTAYVESAERLSGGEDWVTPYSRLKRAVELGSSVRGGHALEIAINAVNKAIDSAGEDDPLLIVHRLLRLLVDFGRADVDRHAGIARRRAARARQAYETHGVGNGLDCDMERELLEVELAIRRRAKDLVGIERVHAEIAESLIRRAEGVVIAKWPACHSIAADFFAAAIEEYQKTGQHKDRVAGLRHRQQQLQRQAIAEMGECSVTGNIEEAVKFARSQVTGKPAMSALFTLAFGHDPPTQCDLQEELALRLQEAPSLGFLPRAYLGPRGTRVAQHGGLVDADANAVNIELMQTAHSRQQLVAITCLLPAAQQIALEHGIDIDFFLGIARSSPFVPEGREYSFARGLAAGMRGDFELASQLLFSQIEHGIRELLFRAGMATTTHPGNASQNEYDLTKLLAMDQAREFFGDDQLFDLRVLLIEKSGANLRHDLAHGLIADGAKGGAKVYMWWWALRLVCFPIMMETRARAGAADGGGADAK